MKKMILSFAITSIAILQAKAQVSYGVQVGTNLANVKSIYTDNGTTTTENGKTKTGFAFGLVGNIPLSTMLSFRPELNYIQKGAKFSSTQTTSGFTFVNTSKTSMNFIEIPLNVVYNMELGAGQFYAGAGPNISFGLSGKDDYTQIRSGGGVATTTTSGSNNIKFDGKKYADLAATDTDEHFKRLDFGANALIGYKMDMGLFLNVGYTLGFSNLDPNSGSTVKTSGITIKVGYLLKGRKE